MLIDREAELAILEERYRSGQAELFVLYGRRRVGKTELLRAFCVGKRHVFFVADQASAANHLAAFSQAAWALAHDYTSESFTFPTWDAMLEFIAEQSRERLIVVLDEFTYLTAADSALPSVLQRWWDARLSRTQLMLVLCGSYIGLMERQTLTHRSPLFGRRTGQWLLEPLELPAAAHFFPDYSPDDAIQAFAILGGTPAYLLKFDDNRSVLENIAAEVLRRGTFLYEEPRFRLIEELREPRNYFSILRAIAQGKARLNEIAQAARIGDLATTNKYLSVLRDLRLVERAVPVTDPNPEKSKKGIYRLADEFFRFWFRFVYPNRTLLEEGQLDFVLRTRVVPQLEDFTAPAFEEMARRFVWQLARLGKLPFVPEQVGGWWSPTAEADVVAINRAERVLLVGECKWASRPVGQNVLNDLKQRAKLLEGEADWSQVYYALFSRNGFTDSLIHSPLPALLATPADLVNPTQMHLREWAGVGKS